MSDFPRATNSVDRESDQWPVVKDWYPAVTPNANTGSPELPKTPGEEIPACCGAVDTPQQQEEMPRGHCKESDVGPSEGSKRRRVESSSSYQSSPNVTREEPHPEPDSDLSTPVAVLPSDDGVPLVELPLLVPVHRRDPEREESFLYPSGESVLLGTPSSENDMNSITTVDLPSSPRLPESALLSVPEFSNSYPVRIGVARDITADSPPLSILDTGMIMSPCEVLSIDLSDSSDPEWPEVRLTSTIRSRSSSDAADHLI
ncbi:hypothetical protein FOL47_009578 [Perkinsus chesapeaki]|uniref:Uncharacterized protein n=1 Tax=Perkinsus chesapeaki TaxID=330153 RepID=A0A7J6MRI7_PERCH|nr:hypothetical protein FOL47_009578 [Perkinsus chesapeaki]